MDHSHMGHGSPAAHECSMNVCCSCPQVTWSHMLICVDVIHLEYPRSLHRLQMVAYQRPRKLDLFPPRRRRTRGRLRSYTVWVTEIRAMGCEKGGRGSAYVLSSYDNHPYNSLLDRFIGVWLNAEMIFLKRLLRVHLCGGQDGANKKLQRGRILLRLWSMDCRISMRLCLCEYYSLSTLGRANGDTGWYSWLIMGGWWFPLQWERS